MKMYFGISIMLALVLLILRVFGIINCSYWIIPAPIVFFGLLLSFAAMLCMFAIWIFGPKPQPQSKWWTES